MKARNKRRKQNAEDTDMFYSGAGPAPENNFMSEALFLLTLHESACILRFMNSTQNMNLTITTHNEDGTVTTENVAAVIINSAADLEAYFAAALNTTEVN